MTVRIRRKRNKTAREVAEKFNISERTVRRYISEERSNYEKRAYERRKLAYILRSKGKPWKEVGEILGCSDEAARALSRRYEKSENLNNNS